MNHRAMLKASLVVSVAAVCYMMGRFAYVSPPVVALDIMADMGLTPDSLSLMFAITLVAYGLIQPLSGFWADRFGPRRCLLIATLVLGLGSLLFSQIQGVGLGLASRAMVGLAAGVTLMPCLKLAGHWFSPRYFGLVSSVVLAISAVGTALTGRPLALAAETFGWRAAFIGVGVAGLLWTILIFFIVHNRPQGPLAGQRPDDPPPPPPEAPVSFRQTAAVILKIPAFWVLGFLYVGTDMLYCAFSSLWVGPYLIEVYGQSEQAAGNMISLAALGYFIGPPLLTLWGDAWGYAKVILAVALLNVLMAFILVLCPAMPGPWALYLLCFMTPMGAQLTAMILALGRSLTPPNIGGAAMGFINLFPIIGGAIMQKIIGRLLTVEPGQADLISAAERYSYAFRPMLAYIILTVVLAWWMVRYEKRRAAST